MSSCVILSTGGQIPVIVYVIHGSRYCMREINHSRKTVKREKNKVNLSKNFVRIDSNVNFQYFIFQRIHHLQETNNKNLSFYIKCKKLKRNAIYLNLNFVNVYYLLSFIILLLLHCKVSKQLTVS